VPEPNHLLRAARERTPSRHTPGIHMSREELAEAVCLWITERDHKRRDVAFDANHLGKLERGTVHRPRDHYVAALCAVLGATETELGLVPATSGAFSSQTMPVSPVPEAWELVDALTRSSISMATLDHMERAALECAAQYPSTPPRVLLMSVCRQMRRVKEALGQPQQVRERQRCVVVLGVLCGLVGNLWFDLGQDKRATGFFDVGELTGQEADDPDLIAWLLATRSIVPFFAGRYAEVTELLTRAEEAAGVRSSARRRAWIASLRARAAAAYDDREQSLAALDRAGQHIGEVTEPPSGTDFFDVPRLEGMAGSTYMLMSDTERAMPLLSRALDGRATEDAKGRALLTLDLAQCHATAREPEEAARLTNEAIDAAHGTLVGPIVARAQAMRAALDPWSQLHAVRDLDARVVELHYGH
jgi:Helix-turn-helix domain